MILMPCAPRRMAFWIARFIARRNMIRFSSCCAIESEIKTRFSDWKPSGTGRPDPDYGTPLKRGQEALVFTEAGAPQSIAVSWMSPYDDRPDTAANRKHDRIERIGLAILNQRFAQAAQSADPPFQAAGAGVGNGAPRATASSSGSRSPSIAVMIA